MMMKFKTLFYLFNAIVLFAFVTFILASMFAIRNYDAFAYGASNWIVVGLFVALIGILDYYFVHNWQMFSLLEKEDWAQLLLWLEKHIYQKGQFYKSYIHLLISTALSVSNLEAVRRLEVEIREKKPKLIRNFGVSLGIPLFLGQDYEAMQNYFQPLVEGRRTLQKDWARWCIAFVDSAKNDNGQGLSELIGLLDSRILVIRLLSFQILKDRLNQLNDEEHKIVNDMKKEHQSILSGRRGKQLLERSCEEHLFASVLSTQIKEARQALLASV